MSTLAIVAQTGNLRCTWPRQGTTTTHAATFAAPSCQVCAEPNIPEGICYRCWYAVARPIVHGVGAPKPEPRVEPKDSPLVSKYGNRLPLRAIPWRELNRRFWSRGEIVPMPNMERSEPRELLAHEKPIEDMTLEDLIATQEREPLSESRRSWLTRGAGVMSLEGITYDEGSIGETIAAQGVDIDTLVETDADLDSVNWQSGPLGTPLELVDPITAKQIEYQQWQHGNSEVIRARIAQGATGLTIQTDRKLMPDAFMRLARSVKRSLAAELRGITTLDEFHQRVDLALDAARSSGITIDATTPDPDEERERFLAPADLEWHTSYERVHAMIAILSDDWSLKRCSRPRCRVFEEHEHVRFAQTVHRRPNGLNNNDETWRNRIFDITSFEIGTHGLVDPLVSEFLR